VSTVRISDGSLASDDVILLTTRKIWADRETVRDLDERNHREAVSVQREQDAPRERK